LQKLQIVEPSITGVVCCWCFGKHCCPSWKGYLPDFAVMDVRLSQIMIHVAGKFCTIIQEEISDHYWLCVIYFGADFRSRHQPRMICWSKSRHFLLSGTGAMWKVSVMCLQCVIKVSSAPNFVFNEYTVLYILMHKSIHVQLSRWSKICSEFFVLYTVV